MSESPSSAAKAVAGAKIDLLRHLESCGSFEATLLADDLLDARTLRELAERARVISCQLRESDGESMGDEFWKEAKQILLRWRDGTHANGA